MAKGHSENPLFNNKPLRIACVGEAMVELSLGIDLRNPNLGFAGDTLNTAIYLRRSIPQEHEVAFVSAIGNDALSEAMLTFIESENVSTQAVKRSETRTLGLYAISTDEHGERSFTYWRENSAARLLFQEDGNPDFGLLGGFDLIYLSAISLAILPNTVRLSLMDWIRNFRADGGLVAFDSNYRPKLWEDQHIAQDTVRTAWENCDIALPTLDDELALFGDVDEQAVISRFEKYDIKAGALKRGALGPLSLGSTEPQPHEYSIVDTVVDSTAAGDSFNGAYIGALASGKSQNDAILAGHACASEVIKFKGAIIPR